MQHAEEHNADVLAGLDADAVLRLGPGALGAASAPARLIVDALRQAPFVLLTVAWDEGFAPEDIGTLVWYCGGEVVRARQGKTYQALVRRRERAHG